MLHGMKKWGGKCCASSVTVQGRTGESKNHTQPWLSDSSEHADLISSLRMMEKIQNTFPTPHISWGRIREVQEVLGGRQGRVPQEHPAVVPWSDAAEGLQRLGTGEMFAAVPKINKRAVQALPCLVGCSRDQSCLLSGKVPWSGSGGGRCARMCHLFALYKQAVILWFLGACSISLFQDLAL